ncbi:MAG: hypothetical protein ACK5PF_03180 [bacterium]
MATTDIWRISDDEEICFFTDNGSYFFQGCAMAGDIVGDVKQVRQANKEANIDISDIVKKYISSSADRNTVEDYLRTQKFALNNQPVASDGSQTLVAIYSEKNLLNVGFHDEIRVIVVFVNNKVDRANGKLIFRSL